MRSPPPSSTTPRLGLALLLAFLALGFTALPGQITDLTPSGTPILGLINSADYSKPGFPYSHNNDLGRMTDGTTASPDLTTWSDTFNTGFGVYDSSYVGFTFAVPPNDKISTLVVTFFLIGDGGWFGQKNQSNPLTDDDLQPPTLQVTLDGTTWTNADSTSDYKTQLNGQKEGRPYPTPKVTFTLTKPVAGVKGIRLVGFNGGSSGFIAIADERVFSGTPALTPIHF